MTPDGGKIASTFAQPVSSFLGEDPGDERDPSTPDHQIISLPADHRSNRRSRARHYPHAVLSILLLAVFQPAPNAIAEPSKPLLTDIRFQGASPQEEMIHIIVRAFSPPELFAIEGGKPRVVCDFLDADLDGTVKTDQKVEGNFIRRIRVVIHRDPSRTRVVLDLSPQHNYDVRQMYLTDQERFILAITPAHPEGEDIAEDDASPQAVIPAIE